MITKLVKVRVTETHIKEGRRCVSFACPITKALNEATALNTWFVGDVYAYNNNNNRDMTTVTLPRAAQRFVRNFDDGKVVKPFNFVLRVYE